MATKKEPVLVQTADHIEWLIDESLEETFPASDPPAVTFAATTAFAAPPLRATKDGDSDLVDKDSNIMPEGMP